MPCSQLAEALDDARRYDSKAPVIFASDFNLDASEEAPATILHRAQFQDASLNQYGRTTPHSFLERGRAIDWIFTRGPLRSSQSQVHRSVTASDHYPLSVTLSLA